jgi:hypothetical protein
MITFRFGGSEIDYLNIDTENTWIPVDFIKRRANITDTEDESFGTHTISFVGVKGHGILYDPIANTDPLFSTFSEPVRNKNVEFYLARRYFSPLLCREQVRLHLFPEKLEASEGYTTEHVVARGTLQGIQNQTVTLFQNWMDSKEVSQMELDDIKDDWQILAGTFLGTPMFETVFSP